MIIKGGGKVHFLKIQVTPNHSHSIRFDQGILDNSAVPRQMGFDISNCNHWTWADSFSAQNMFWLSCGALIAALAIYGAKYLQGYFEQATASEPATILFDYWPERAIMEILEFGYNLMHNHRNSLTIVSLYLVAVGLWYLLGFNEE
jgi:hypothetical protein